MLPHRLEPHDEEDEEGEECTSPPALPPAFRRGRSRVYHASEWREEDWTMILPRNRQVNEKQLTPPPEEQQDWGLLLSAPGGPPSHRSQDSGFSDSESEASPHQLLEFKPLPKPNKSSASSSPVSSSPTPGLPTHCSTPKTSRLRPCNQRRSLEHQNVTYSPEQIPLSPLGTTIGCPINLLLLNSRYLHVLFITFYMHT
jgi:hypothetical protein